MFRKSEKEVTWKAGMLAAAVHIVLFGALVIAAKWKAAHAVISVSEVQLWDKLPGKTTPKPSEVKVKPKPEEPKVEEKPEIKPPEPPPEPKVEEPKPDPAVEIALKKKEDEKKKAEEEKKKKLEAQKKKKLAEKRKKEKERKKQLAKLREEDLKQEDLERKKLLDSLRDDVLDEGGTDDEKQTAANVGVVNGYISKIQNKIRGNVNKRLCGDGNPELRFKIGLLPNGELKGAPTLLKSSGNAVCDDAVERAIIASEPLPIPADPNDYAEFRDLNLKFRPNDN